MNNTLKKREKREKRELAELKAFVRGLPREFQFDCERLDPKAEQPATDPQDAPARREVLAADDVKALFEQIGENAPDYPIKQFTA
jgi:hypothetical protein